MSNCSHFSLQLQTLKLKPFCFRLIFSLVCVFFSFIYSQFTQLLGRIYIYSQFLISSSFFSSSSIFLSLFLQLIKFHQITSLFPSLFSFSLPPPLSLSLSCSLSLSSPFRRESLRFFVCLFVWFLNVLVNY